MFRRIRFFVLVVCSFACTSLLFAQTGQPANPLAGAEQAPIVPPVVNFTGRLSARNGQPLAGTAGVTFLLYADQQGGAPLWMETQSIRVDRNGNYSVALGSSKAEGLPSALFAAGQARWLAVQVEGQEESQRLMLFSVPYAMKAGDAQTLAGLPASAFMLAPVTSASTPAETPASAASASTPAATPALGGTGTTNFLPLWTNATTLGSSVLFQSGTGATAKVGIGTTTPAATLDVKGTTTLRGLLTFPATGVATAAAGKVSPAIGFTASVFNSSSTTAVNQNFRLQAEPVGNNTTTATGSLNLLFAQGAGAIAETGLKFGGNGVITFAPGQTFPGTGPGTITGVTAGSGLTGGGTSGSVSVGLDTTKVPLLSANNVFTGDQTLTGSWVINKPGGIGLNVTAGNQGLYAESGLTAVTGAATGTEGTGVAGTSSGAGGIGVFGQGPDGGYGMYAYNGSSSGQALWALNYATVGANGVGADAIHAVAVAKGASAVAGVNATSGGIGIYGAVFDSSSQAGHFDGNVVVNGSLSKSGGSFKIDDPIDPANKYLYHSFVESPDMKNIYDGKVVTDAEGNAVVSMPAWFEALNRDFRYQLTVIGQFAQAIVSQEMENRQFHIKTDKPNVKVSWQVTGIRQDAWANAHRIPVEEEKSTDERGTYLYPELFGAPKEAGLSWKLFRYPDVADPSKIKSPIGGRRRLEAPDSSAVNSQGKH